MTKVTITPDSELATVEAINYRITQLRREMANGAVTISKMALSRRIEALKSRLPKTENGPIAPPVDAVLLVSKGEMERGYKL